MFRFRCLKVLGLGGEVGFILIGVCSFGISVFFWGIFEEVSVVVFVVKLLLEVIVFGFWFTFFIGRVIR